MKDCKKPREGSKGPNKFSTASTKQVVVVNETKSNSFVITDPSDLLYSSESEGENGVRLVHVCTGLRQQS